MTFRSETQSTTVISTLPLTNVVQPQVKDIVSAQNDRGTPVLRLPTEILLYIFIWYTSWSEADWQADKRIDRRPILLSHVCSKWRRIVLESSTLWTCIPFHSDVDARTTIIHRSREQSVDIVHCHVPSAAGRVDRRLVKTLEGMADRWRSVLWDSCEDAMQDMLLALNNAPPMSHLHTLEIGVQTRTLPGDPLFRPIDSGDPERSLLPNLQHICLSRISLAELPLTTFPRLRTLALHWPAQYPTTRPTLFRMSTVLAFLQRAPKLESLNFLKSCPLMDVLPLRRDAANTHGSTTAGSHGIIFSPVCMASLHYLEWSYAPPRDLYRLFLYLDAPNLRRLELRLDSAEQRWFTLYDARLEPLDEDEEGDENSPLFLRDGKMRPFTQLVELHLHVSDISGLCHAVRRMAFPQLRHLTLVFLRKRAIRLSAKADNHRRSGLGTMPSLDSILHEPRLATLTHLTLSGFDLERSAAMSTLAYLRSLEYLTFDKCEGAGQVICALAGAKCGSTLGAIRSWTCPHLQHLDIIDCEDVTFKCLKEAVFVRKMYAEGKVQDTRANRPVKPLRRTARLDSSKEKNSRPANEPFSEQDLTELYATVPSQPLERIRSIVVQGGVISEPELLSLQGEDYGVDETQWTP